jgi:hypothetical protein
MTFYHGTLPAGTYNIDVTMYWSTVDVPDLTVRVIAPYALSVTGGSVASVSH